jgi:hypothetical protein
MIAENLVEKVFAMSAADIYPMHQQYTDGIVKVVDVAVSISISKIC